MNKYIVRYKWIAANSTCKGVYTGGSKEEVIKKIEANGNKVISIKRKVA